MKKVLFLTVMLFLLAACGKKGPLVPPESLVPASIKDLAVEQKGNRFLVCWSRPGKEEWGGPIEDLAGFRVLRRIVLPPDMDCEECRDAYRSVKIVDPEFPRDVLRFGSRYCFFDGELVNGKTYQYKVLSFEKDGSTSRDSNKFRRTKTAPPLPPEISAVPTPDGVTLRWKAPSPIPGATLEGFAIYRKQVNQVMPLYPIATVTADTLQFADPTMEHGTVYYYAVRTISRFGSEEVESDLSNEVKGLFSLSE